MIDDFKSMDRPALSFQHLFFRFHVTLYVTVDFAVDNVYPVYLTDLRFIRSFGEYSFLKFNYFESKIYRSF